MNCKKCKSSWFTSADIEKNIRDCPFCHTPLYVNAKAEKPDFSKVKTDVINAMSYIIYEYSESIIWDKQRLTAYLWDIAPALSKERRRIKLAFKVGAVEIIKDSANRSNDIKYLAAVQAAACLMNEADVAEAVAKETVGYFMKALNWKVSLKSKAEMWFEKAAEAYESEDYKTAFKFAGLSADDGNAAAQNLLGDCYYWGHGVMVDEHKAAEWYKKAADNGDSNAMCSLGDCYSSGAGVPLNIEKARQYYRRSASLGNRRAMLEI